MKISFVSTQAVSRSLSQQLMRMQSELAKSQSEVTSGKHADIGVALGARTGHSVALARDVERLKGLKDSNGLISTRLDATQDALKKLSEAAEEFQSSLTVAGSTTSTQGVLQVQAANTLNAATSILNSSLNGEYLFAGINTDVKPINDFEADGSPNRVAFDQAFQDFFGFAKDSADAANVTAENMTQFVDTVVKPMFLGSGWSESWSNATDETIQSRIALNETTQSSVSANDDGVRKLLFAATAISNLFDSQLNVAAKQAVIDGTSSYVNESIADIAAVAARTGLTQNRIDSATTRISMQIDIFKGSIDDMEGVDVYEASSKVNALLTQIETSYALTARIQQLNLLDYL